MWHVWGRVEMHTWFWWEKWRERDHLQDIRVNRRTIFERMLKNSVGRALNGMIWLRIGIGGELL
jgi:hypothetical protein